jgi:hypothetical protein
MEEKGKPETGKHPNVVAAPSQRDEPEKTTGEEKKTK